MANKFTTTQMVGLSLASTGAQAISEFALGEARGELFKINERINRLRAEDARKRGQERVALKRQRGEKAIGATKAALAASGIRTDIGSARDIQEEIRDVTEVDATTIRINALREAFGFETEAELASTEGKLARGRSRLSAVDTLLSGGVRAAGYYYGKER